jgi:hypothetical protein
MSEGRSGDVPATPDATLPESRSALSGSLDREPVCRNPGAAEAMWNGMYVGRVRVCVCACVRNVLT